MIIDAQDHPPRTGAAPWWPSLLVAAGTVLAYANALDGAFLFDDFGAIVDNPGLRQPGLPATWWSPRWVGDLTFALNFKLGGLEVLGYHLVNLVIHVANGLLVFALARTILRTPALREAAAGPLLRRHLPLVAATLFALHPMATQAVTYVVQRYASLATLFFLVALLLHLRARLALEEGGRARAGAAAGFALAVLAAACAMKTKEIAFTLPVVALGLELLCFQGPLGRRALLLGPLAATALLVPLAHLGAEPAARLGRALAETDTIPRGIYLLTQARVVVTYLRLLFLPVGQHLDRDFPLSASILDPAVLLSLGLLAALLWLALWRLAAARRAGRAAGVLAFLGVGWFFVTLSVESSVLPIRDVFFEHRVYLPSVGWAIAVGTALLVGLERLRLGLAPGLQVGALVLVVGAPLGAATHARNHVWKDELSLWGESVARSPGKARPHHALGVALANAGRVPEAIEQYQLALRLKLGYPEALVNLGDAYRAIGREEDALRIYQQTVLVAPTVPEAHNNLGAMYEARGRLAEALGCYREALRLDPRQAHARRNLARLLQRHPELAGPP
jgi:protein O-mannosyl-transferase